MAAPDYRDYPEGPTGPATKAAEITPANTDLAQAPRALYIGVTGNLVVEMQGGQEVVFYAVPAGMLLPIRVAKVKASTTAQSPTITTTATGIVGIW